MVSEHVSPLGNASMMFLFLFIGVLFKNTDLVNFRVISEIFRLTFSLSIFLVFFLWIWLWQRWEKCQCSSIRKENDLRLILLTCQVGCCVRPNNILKAVLIKKAVLGDISQWVGLHKWLIKCHKLYYWKYSCYHSAPGIFCNIIYL